MARTINHKNNLTIKKSMRTKVRITHTARLRFSDMTFAKGLYIKFAAL